METMDKVTVDVPQIETPEETKVQEPVISSDVVVATADQASVQAQQAQMQATKVRGLFRVETIQEEMIWLKALIYGKYGAGKTTLAATVDELPSMKDVLFINAESGTMSLRTRFPHLDSIRISNWAQFSQIHQYLRLHVAARDKGDITQLIKLESMVRGVDPFTIKTPKQYKSLVVDSLSEVQKYCMMQMMGIRLEDVQLDYPPDSPGYQQWGQTGEQIQTLIRVFRDLPLNVIFICSEKEEQDEAKRYHFKPNLPGKLANNVQGFFDVVGYLAMATTQKQVGTQTVTEHTRRLFLQPSPFFDAKTRIGSKIQYIDDPTIEKLLACN